MVLSKSNRILLLIAVAALLLRLLMAVPGIMQGAEETFSRPDTTGYLGPARALSHNMAFLDAPDGSPTAVRAPGFPIFAAPILAVSGVRGLAIALCFASALCVFPVFLAGREAGNDRTGLIAAGLLALNPTAIANAPLFLTDTLFTLVIAFQLYWMLRFRRTKQTRFFFGVTILTAAGTLIRPIEIAWIFPALVLLGALPGLPWRQKLLAGMAGTLLFLAILFPWQFRNASIGAGYCIDTNTGAMYHQNGAMILAAAHGTDYEQEKQRILAECAATFADTERFPDEKSRVDYKLKRLREIICAHPFYWLRGHFQFTALLPDAATFFENLGLTQSGRGTLNVLRERGAFAAANYYFEGKLWIPALLTPFLLISGLAYFGAFLMLAHYVCTFRRNYYWLLLALAFIEYFLFMPGPITVPRYQLPALPMIAILAALAYQRWMTILQEEKG